MEFVLFSYVYFLSFITFTLIHFSSGGFLLDNCQRLLNFIALSLVHYIYEYIKKKMFPDYNHNKSAVHPCSVVR